MALGLFASDADYDYGPMLDEIKALGATHVQLDVVWMQRTQQSVRIHRYPGVTPSDAAVLRTLRQAKERGLAATLFPIVRLEQHTRAQWRGTLAPAAGVDAWFSSYRDFLVLMAALARRGEAAQLSVGSEFVSLEGEVFKWRVLIDEVRTHFAGDLLYSANWDHFAEVPFWDRLDEAGVTAYFELAHDDALPSERSLDEAWAAPRASLAAMRERVHKRLIVTEVGYPSLVGAAHKPWDETAVAAVDLEGQARLLGAFCRAFRPATDKSVAVDGFYVWNWFGSGAADGSYSPRGKPAARAVAACMRSW